MGSFGGFYFGEKRRKKKGDLEKKTREISFQKPFVLPKVEIIKKKREPA